MEEFDVFFGGVSSFSFFSSAARYTLIINLARMVDLVEGTTFNHIINPLQLPLTVWHANLTRLPPVLDWTTNNGPRSLLFDICKVRGRRSF